MFNPENKSLLKKLTGIFMDEQHSLTARQVVDKRFQLVSTKHPINALLYNLALNRVREHPATEDFTKDIQIFIPNANDYLEMRQRVNLLPLDTIQERIKLPSAPGVLLRLQKALIQRASSKHIAEIIQFDLKLTAAILSLVNSPLYALPFRVENLERAVTIIGTREISSLGLSVRMLSMFEDTSPDGLPLNIFWKHSVACAVLAHDLARLCARPEQEKYLAAGLMHDMGRALLFTHYPDLAKVALSLQQENEIPLFKAELDLFDVEHTLLGGVLFGDWKMPQNIIHAALYHHDPQMCLGKEVPEIVYVANQIATALGISCNRFYDLDPAEEIWQRLNIQETELYSLLEGLDDRLWAIFCSLFPAAKTCKR